MKTKSFFSFWWFFFFFCEKIKHRGSVKQYWNQLREHRNENNWIWHKDITSHLGRSGFWGEVGTGVNGLGWEGSRIVKLRRQWLDIDFKKNYFYTNFKGYFPFTVITKYWLYSPCDTLELYTHIIQYLSSFVWCISCSLMPSKSILVSNFCSFYVYYSTVCV